MSTESADSRSFPFADLALAQRLEKAEARSNAGFVETKARLFPQSGAAWIQVGGACAMFDGADSPLTQTFGLGLEEPVSSADMETIEHFFEERGAPVFHEVSPLADPTVLAQLNQRGYQPIEFTSVLFMPIHPETIPGRYGSAALKVRLVRAGEDLIWSQTAAKGWSHYPGLDAFMATIGQISVNRTDTQLFLAELEGQPVATGGLNFHGGVALLAGASTVPEARRQGAQSALLSERLRYAAQQGCDIAMMGAQPGSDSQRNAERQGFRIAYTRVKWQLVK
jgi:GNAT superfamily N-acetyltransferase